MTAKTDLRTRILASTLKSERVEVPEFGGATIELRELTAAQRGEVLTAIQEGGGSAGQWAASVFVRGAYDPESGARIFGDDDRDAVASLSAVVVDRLAGRITKLSGMHAEAVEEAKGN
jgi:hypothetical protein